MAELSLYPTSFICTQSIQFLTMVYSLKMSESKQKLYCYVDENGQDTKGKIFIVSIVITGDERDKLMEFCEEIEIKSGKKKDKWGRASYKRRIDYLKSVFSITSFKKKLRYSLYRGQVNYDMATIMGIAKAVHFKEPENYTTIIYVDGLARTKRHEYGSQLRKLGIPTRKVQGVVKDENNALIRLADAIAGFIRDAVEGNDVQLKSIFIEALEKGILIEV